jgi:predicted nucleic acid-binding protein
MVVMDSTVLLLLFDPEASPPLNPKTGKPLERCQDRVDWLLQTLSEAKEQVMIPTPVLSEILVAAGAGKAELLNRINNVRAFKIQPFDTVAAIEVAMLTDRDLQSDKKFTAEETKAKVKYDRQIIAIAKVNGVKTIYSDDRKLRAKAVENGITVITTAELPLPPDSPQGELPLPNPD